MEAKILRLPEPLLLAILDFSFDQVEFVRVSSSALYLWRKIRRIEMDATSFLRSSIQYQKEIISQVHNPYNQLVLMFDKRLSNEEELQSARDEIQRAYNEENNEKTKDTDILRMGNENENLYNMVISNWSFESAYYLSIGSKDVFPIFGNSKLKKINWLHVTCNDSDNSDSIQKIFQYFRMKNSFDELELKHLYVFQNRVEPKMTLDPLPSIPGLEELGLNSFVIAKVDFVLKFPHLTELDITDCDISCDINCFDNIDTLKLFSCSLQVGDISGLNHNRKIVISGCEGVRDFSKSFKYSEYIQINSCEVDAIVDLRNYQNVIHLLLTDELKSSRMKFLLPERLSPRLKKMYLNNVKAFAGPLPPNNIRQILLDNCSGLKTFQGMENIPFIELDRCPISVHELGKLNANTKRLKDINPISENYDSLTFCESLFIRKAVLMKPIQLPQLKELFLQDCQVFMSIFENSEFNLRELRTLRLVHCTFISSGEIHLPNLEVLEADRSFFTSKNIIICPNLQKVIVQEKDSGPFIWFDVPLQNPQLQYRPLRSYHHTILRGANDSRCYNLITIFKIVISVVILIAWIVLIH
eukprot:gene14984-16685_t